MGSLPGSSPASLPTLSPSFSMGLSPGSSLSESSTRRARTSLSRSSGRLDWPLLPPARSTILMNGCTLLTILSQLEAWRAVIEVIYPRLTLPQRASPKAIDFADSRPVVWFRLLMSPFVVFLPFFLSRSMDSIVMLPFLNNVSARSTWCQGL